MQPEWTPGGGLLATSDRTGWWNVYRFTGGDLVLEDPEPLTPIDAEIGGAAVGLRSVVVRGAARRHVRAVGRRRRHAVARGRAAAETGRLERLDTPYTEIGQLRAGR